MNRLRAQFLAEREAILKAAADAERIAKPIPVDPRDAAAEKIAALLGEKFVPVTSVFQGAGGDANLVFRRLQHMAQRRLRNASKQAARAEQVKIA